MSSTAPGSTGSRAKRSQSCCENTGQFPNARSKPRSSCAWGKCATLRRGVALIVPHADPAPRKTGRARPSYRKEITPMTRTTAEKRARFRALHASGCLVLPNPWDVGSARMFQHLGFEALASTSRGYAWSTGRPDYGVTRSDVLGHLSALSGAVDLPVNADFESGFATDPQGVAESVRLAIGTGVAGLSIEDRDLENGRFY